MDGGAWCPWGHKESDTTKRLYFHFLFIPEWSSGFPYFLQFKPEFGNKEFMIWATVSSGSCFCWLYRASPLAAKNIIYLILVLTIWWCPSVESSLVFLEEGVCCDQCILLAKTLLAFALLHFELQGQICLLLQVSLDFLLLHSSPVWRKEHLLGY